PPPAAVATLFASGVPCLQRPTSVSCEEFAPGAVGTRPGRGPAGGIAVSVELANHHTKAAQWTRRHLLGLEELSREELLTILDTPERFVEVAGRRRKKRGDLKGKVVVTLFFEASTRTRASFGFAAKRLGADTSDFAAASSSLNKGESFID